MSYTPDRCSRFPLNTNGTTRTFQLIQFPIHVKIKSLFIGYLTSIAHQLGPVTRATCVYDTVVTIAALKGQTL